RHGIIHPHDAARTGRLDAVTYAGRPRTTRTTPSADRPAPPEAARSAPAPTPAVAGHLDRPVAAGRGAALPGRPTALPGPTGLDRERRDGAAALRGRGTGLRTAGPGTAAGPGATAPA